MDQPYHVEIPLSVVYSNKLILVDASWHINPIVQQRKVILDSLNDVAALENQLFWMTVDDLGSGYWHLPLHLSQFKYFGCNIQDPYSGQKIISYG